MMHFKCDGCGCDILVHTVVGSVPPQVPLKTYCSDQCLEKVQQENPAPNEP